MPAARIDALCDALAGAGALSITLCDAADAPVYEPAPGETPMWAHTELDALFPLDVQLGVVRDRLAAELGVPCERTLLDVRFVEDADWSQSWRNHAVEYCFGDRLWVVPRDAATPRSVGPGDTKAVLRLDPGLAFGTGSHATTAMCLDWLVGHALTKWSVVDYGAGSGILGIAALLLDAATVVAVDHDEQARLATRANGTYNGIASKRLRVIAPDELAKAPHDLVLANILAEPLIALAPTLTALVRPGGSLVLSGMLARQLGDVVAAYPDFAFEPADERDSWIMIEGIRAGG